MRDDGSGTGLERPPGRVLMLQGTASDVGKSIVTTALARIFVQDGHRTAPFKSQNMALNSYVTADGKEIGRAQGVQAEACGIEATTDMNPVLIKPTGDMHSQIVVHGRPLVHLSATEYRTRFLPEAKHLVMESLNRLRTAYDIVLIEGAGSPAEINLKDRDIVNMNLAGWAGAPVVLVADIDRGGVFAFIIGTLELLEPHERSRVKGFIINKFRGDLSLLQPGLDWLEQRTGIPVLGVIPHISNLDIEAEDSVALEARERAVTDGEEELDIAVIRYPRISNFTDMDPLAREGDVRVRYVTRPEDLGSPDVIVLPGTKDTIGDLRVIRESGLELAIRQAMDSGTKQLFGICGGYQMLGRMLSDPGAVESGKPDEAAGLGYLPLDTVFSKEKTTVRVTGRTHEDHKLPLSGELHGSFFVNGYEIHMGETSLLEPGSAVPLFHILRKDGQQHTDGYVSTDGRVWGTYLHGLFESDLFRRSWLDALRVSKGLKAIKETYSASERKQLEFDRLADVVRGSLDMDKVYGIMNSH